MKKTLALALAVVMSLGLLAGCGDKETKDPANNGGSSNGGTTVTPPGSGTVTVSGGSYTFNGGGWGHQVGMSQFGANAMARRGFTGDQIITFYFPGVQVTHY